MAIGCFRSQTLVTRKATLLFKGGESFSNTVWIWACGQFVINRSLATFYHTLLLAREINNHTFPRFSKCASSLDEVLTLHRMEYSQASVIWTCFIQHPRLSIKIPEKRICTTPFQNKNDLDFQPIIKRLHQKFHDRICILNTILSRVFAIQDCMCQACEESLKTIWTCTIMKQSAWQPSS